MEEKKANLEELKQQCITLAFEIAKLHSIASKHQKRFNELTYQIFKIEQNDQEAISQDS